MLSNFEHYLEIINLLYFNQEPIDADKTFRFKLKKKIILLKIQNVGENIGSVLYNNNLFKKYEQYKKS